MRCAARARRAAVGGARARTVAAAQGAAARGGGAAGGRQPPLPLAHCVVSTPAYLTAPRDRGCALLTSPETAGRPSADCAGRPSVPPRSCCMATDVCYSTRLTGYYMAARRLTCDLKALPGLGEGPEAGGGAARAKASPLTTVMCGRRARRQATRPAQHRTLGRRHGCRSIDREARTVGVGAAAGARCLPAASHNTHTPEQQA